MSFDPNPQAVHFERGHVDHILKGTKRVNGVPLIEAVCGKLGTLDQKTGSNRCLPCERKYFAADRKARGEANRRLADSRFREALRIAQAEKDQTS